MKTTISHHKLETASKVQFLNVEKHRKHKFTTTLMFSAGKHLVVATNVPTFWGMKTRLVNKLKDVLFTYEWDEDYESSFSVVSDRLTGGKLFSFWESAGKWYRQETKTFLTIGGKSAFYHTTRSAYYNSGYQSFSDSYTRTEIFGKTVRLVDGETLN